jgi:hypothetical protein
MASLCSWRARIRIERPVRGSGGNEEQAQTSLRVGTRSIVTTNASEDDDLGAGYDAGQAPDPEAWLAMDESERLLAVLLHHAKDAPHPPAPSPDVHAGVHVAVETQIAMGTPPAAAATLTRLVAEGLSRHEAVHAVAGVLSRTLFDMLQRTVPFDEVVYEHDLAQLTAAGWRASADDRPRGPAPARSHRRHPKRKRHAHR